LALDLNPLLGQTTVLVHLGLQDHEGALLSENLYWRAASDAGYRALTTLAPARVAVSVAMNAAGRDDQFEVHLKNTSTVAALNTKLTTLYADDGSEVLPAFYSDNYISLLPGEERTVTIDTYRADRSRALRVKIRGWNAVPEKIEVRRPTQ
jgi:hypothetical protein